MMERETGGHAVVMGASIGGLLAARALSDHFKRVTVLERDSLPEAAEPRKGVPQGRHTHGLLAGGLAALKRFFPGIRDELVERGSLIGDIVGDSLWLTEGGQHVRCETGLIGVTQSRPLLESVVRRRVSALPNVTLRDRVRVEQLIPDGFRRRVVGIQLTNRMTDRTEILPTDLVVDATGRGSRMPQWLEDLGYAAPRKDRVDVQLSYATRIYRRRPGDFENAMAVIVTQCPPNTRLGVAVAIEDDRWSLTLGGMFNDVPPGDDAGFNEFAGGLPSPVIDEFLQTAEPVSDIQLLKYPASIRQRYEWLRRFPEGLLVLGDSLCSFNPIYGQGMSVAALEAELLSQCLNLGRQRLAARFFPSAARLVDVPWQIAVGGDFRFAGVRGRRPRLVGLANEYLRLVHLASHRDPVVATAYHRVGNLLATPSSLLRPRILSRVLRNWWRNHPADPRCSRRSDARDAAHRQTALGCG
jgi:2-polyprenyl-6-methoxyphenol hydroxylase-like FAD-dependent oxidoreductase